jgi:hypothetical protein
MTGIFAKPEKSRTRLRWVVCRSIAHQTEDAGVWLSWKMNLSSEQETQLQDYLVEQLEPM